MGLARALTDPNIRKHLRRPVISIGNITTGSGFSIGPGYRQPAIFGGHGDFSTFAAASMSKYWIHVSVHVAPARLR